MTDLAAVQALMNLGLWHGVIVFLRVAPMVAFLPGIGEQSVPVRVKLGLAIATTLPLAALLPVTFNRPPDLAQYLPYIFSETLVGLTLGLAIRLMLLALQTAGVMIAQATSLAQILGDAGVEPMPAIGHLLIISGITLAMISGAHLKAIALLTTSYQVWPAGSWPDFADLARLASDTVATSFALAFSLSLPFLAVSLLYNVMLGVVNRAMPQLMVAFIGAPLITLGGIALIFLLAPAMLTAWRNALFFLLENGTPPNV